MIDCGSSPDFATSVVTGVGGYLPKRVLTNEELSRMVDTSDDWIVQRTGIHRRHIAAEGRCWVLGSGGSIQARDIPAGFPDRDRLYPDPDEWLNPGDSIIVAPGGKMELAMQLIFTPMILQLMDRKRRA